MPKPPKPTEVDRQNAFLSAYGDTVDIEQAAALANVSTASHYRWLKTNTVYKEAWALTIAHLVDRLVTAGYHRAILGVPKVLTHKGELIMVPAINKYTGAIEKINGRKVMVPLIEWQIDHRSWDRLLAAWDPMLFNRGQIASKVRGEAGRVKGKKIIVVDQRQYPRIASNGTGGRV